MRRTEVLRASPRMFRSDALDRLTRVPHWLPAVLFGPVVAVMLGAALARSGALSVAAGAAGGWLGWTLTEYWVHRVVFHFEPEAGLGARLHWMAHGVHHDHPNDPQRLVMPPIISVPFAVAFFGLFVLVLGLDRALAVHGGFVLGYLVYDAVHYRLHHGVPRGRAGRRLRALHMRHHFEDDTRGFGITAPWWDRVFGTAVRGRPATRPRR
jgi:sterol desaturase/sphingolipid hydroxylase (fatty acid hydroxylase superfamily)